MIIKPRALLWILDIRCFWMCVGICTAISEGWGGVVCIYGCGIVCDDSLYDPN